MPHKKEQRKLTFRQIEKEYAVLCVNGEDGSTSFYLVQGTRSMFDGDFATLKRVRGYIELQRTGEVIQSKIFTPGKGLGLYLYIVAIQNFGKLISEYHLCSDAAQALHKKLRKRKEVKHTLDFWKGTITYEPA